MVTMPSQVTAVAKEIAEEPGLTWDERVGELMNMFNLLWDVAVLELEPFYLPIKSSEDLVREGYVGSANPELRHALERVRNSSMDYTQKISYLAEALKIPPVLAVELIVPKI